MRLPSLMLLMSCLTVSAAPFSESVLSDFAKWKEAVLAEVARPEGGSGPVERRVAHAQSRIKRIEQALANGTEAWGSIENSGSPLPSGVHSDVVTDSWEAFLNRGRQEVEQSRTSLGEQVKSLVARLQHLVATTERPEDFDGIILQLDPAEFGGRHDSTALSAKVEMARRFAFAWQEYLTAKVTGDENRRSQALSQLISPQSEAYQFISRSKLLLEQEGRAVVPPEEIAAVLAGVKQVEDLPKAIESISTMGAPFRRSGAGDQSLIWVLGGLTTLQRIRTEAQAGLGVRFYNLSQQYANQGLSGNLEIELVRIRAMVMRSLIGYVVGTIGIPGIGETEGVEAYAKRAMDHALSTGDLECLVRLSPFSGGMASLPDFGLSPSGLSNGEIAVRQATSQSLTSCFAARNFEAAGEPLSAVMAWHAALKCGSPYTPAEYIGRRLQGIRKNHPEAYDQAMARVLREPDVPAGPR